MQDIYFHLLCWIFHLRQRGTNQFSSELILNSAANPVNLMNGRWFSTLVKEVWCMWVTGSSGLIGAQAPLNRITLYTKSYLRQETDYYSFMLDIQFQNWDFVYEYNIVTERKVSIIIQMNNNQGSLLSDICSKILNHSNHIVEIFCCSLIESLVSNR